MAAVPATRDDVRTLIEELYAVPNDADLQLRGVQHPRALALYNVYHNNNGLIQGAILQGAAREVLQRAGLMPAAPPARPHAGPAPAPAAPAAARHDTNRVNDRVSRAWREIAVDPTLKRAYDSNPAQNEQEENAIIRAKEVCDRLRSAQFRAALEETLLNKDNGDLLLGVAKKFSGEDDLGLRLDGGPDGRLGAAAFEAGFTMLVKYAKDKDAGVPHQEAKATVKLMNKVFKRLQKHAVKGYLFLNPNGFGARRGLAIKGTRAYYVANRGSVKPKAIAIKVHGTGDIQTSRLTQAQLVALNAALDTGGLTLPYQFLFCMMKYSPAYLRWASRISRGKRRKLRLAKITREVETMFANEANDAALKAIQGRKAALKIGKGVKSKKQVGPVGICAEIEA